MHTLPRSYLIPIQKYDSIHHRNVFLGCVNISSIIDVAKKAGVSISTVSAYINNTRYVSDELTVRIKEAIEDLNYETNSVARSLKSGKTKTIGIIIPNMTRVFFPQLIKGIVNTVKNHGYNLILCDSSENADQEQHYINMLKNSWVDGIILDSILDLSPDNPYVNKLLNDKENNKQPSIVFIEHKPKQTSCNSIIVNNEYGGYLATKYMLDLGHKKVFHISAQQNNPMIADRLLGYKTALSEKGIPFDGQIVKYGDLSPLSGYYCMKLLLNERADMSAVFAANDQMAVGAIKAIKEAGLHIPEDIGIIGFDNIFITSMIDPSLTTISVPKYMMGVEAAEMLIRHIEDTGLESEVIELPINLIERRSTNLRSEVNWDLFDW